MLITRVGPGLGGLEQMKVNLPQRHDTAHFIGATSEAPALFLRPGAFNVHCATNNREMRFGPFVGPILKFVYILSSVLASVCIKMNYLNVSMDPIDTTVRSSVVYTRKHFFNIQNFSFNEQLNPIIILPSTT